MLKLFPVLSSMFERSTNFRVIIISALQHRTLINMILKNCWEELFRKKETRG